MKINVEILRALCANVDKMVDAGRLPERMKGVTKLALAGEHIGFVDIVQRAMMNPDSFTDERLDELLAQPVRPLKRDANRFASRPRIGDGGIFPPALDDYILGFTRVPARLSGYARVEEAIEARLTGLKKSLTEEERRTVIDEALARIGRGLGLRVAESLERSAQPMPPLPGTEKFVLEMVRILRLPSQRVESWRGSILWKHMVIPIFLWLLTEHGNEKSIADIEANIEFKGRWFRELQGTGVTDEQLEWSLGRPNYRKYPNLKAGMHAELRRFSRTDYGDSSSEKSRVKLLSSDIMNLHEMDTSLPIDRFVSLLPPYLDDMSADGIMLALDDHLQFDKGRTWGSFLWHLPPSDFVASRFADMVEDSGFTWLSDFANYNCRVSLGEFKGRVAQMEAANIYTGRLEMNIRRTFLAERPPDEREGGGGGMCAVTCDPMIPEAMGLGMSTMAMSAMLAARVGMVV